MTQTQHTVSCESPTATALLCELLQSAPGIGITLPAQSHERTTQAAQAEHTSALSAALLSLPGELWAPVLLQAQQAHPACDSSSANAPSLERHWLLRRITSHPVDALSEQALHTDLKALAAHWGLHLAQWPAHPTQSLVSAVSADPYSASPWPSPSLDVWAQTLPKGLQTSWACVDKAQTLFGRWGQHLCAQRIWQALAHHKPLHIAFIHGYGGSVHGNKAQYLATFCHSQGLPYLALAREGESDPAQALAAYEAQLQPWAHQPVLLVGSSLGGFYAAQLAHRLGHASLLINPSVAPQDTLPGRLPLEACRRFNAYVTRPAPRMHLLLATDDELLDHQRTVHMLPGLPTHWHDAQGHRWHDNTLIGNAILALIAAHRQPQPPTS